jgi:hypothetical protein
MEGFSEDNFGIPTACAGYSSLKESFNRNYPTTANNKEEPGQGEQGQEDQEPGQQEEQQEEQGEQPGQQEEQGQEQEGDQEQGQQYINIVTDDEEGGYFVNIDAEPAVADFFPD